MSRYNKRIGKKHKHKQKEIIQEKDIQQIISIPTIHISPITAVDSTIIPTNYQISFSTNIIINSTSVITSTFTLDLPALEEIRDNDVLIPDEIVEQNIHKNIEINLDTIPQVKENEEPQVKELRVKGPQVEEPQEIEKIRVKEIEEPWIEEIDEDPQTSSEYQMEEQKYEEPKREEEVPGDDFEELNEELNTFNDSYGAREQFYMKAPRRMDSENRRSVKNIYSSGILPFHVKNKTIYFLLGKDPEGKWSDFGGRSEVQDMGRWNTTAAREFYEETIGSVMDIQTIITKLQNPKYNVKIKGKTLNGSSYFMYVLKIPHKETYRHNFQSTLSFIKYIKYNSKNADDKKSFVDYKYFEKTDIQWVSLETIKMSLDPLNQETVNYPLRSVFKKTLEQNFDEIVKFCSSFYDSNVFNITHNEVVSENLFIEENEEVPILPPPVRTNSYKQYYTSNFFKKNNSNNANHWRS